MTTPITTTTQLDTPDPSPTVLALAQALATRDGQGAAFTSMTKTESAARIASEYIREAKRIAVHLPAPTDKPGRDEVAQVINPRPWGYRYEPFRAFGEARSTSELIESDREDVRLIADAVLAILPGKTEAQVRAEALRDAAEALDALQTPEEGLPAAVRRDPALWLSIRADEEAGK